MRPSRHTAGAVIAATAACLIGTAGAEADIVFCNKSGQSLIYVAIAYPQSNGTYLSRGWMGLSDGECAIFDTAIHVRTFYFRAEGEWRRAGRRRRVREVWGKGRPFATYDNSNFQYYNAQERVLNSKLEEFTQGPEAENGDVSATVTFTDTGSSVSLNSPTGAATPPAVGLPPPPAAPPPPPPADEGGDSSGAHAQ